MKWLLNRLKERSTWSALIALASVAGLNLQPELKEQIITVGVALVAIVGIVTKDAGSPDNGTGNSEQRIVTPELTAEQRKTMGLDN